MGCYDSGFERSLSGFRSGKISAILHLAGKAEEMRMRFRSEEKVLQHGWVDLIRTGSRRLEYLDMVRILLDWLCYREVVRKVRILERMDERL